MWLVHVATTNWRAPLLEILLLSLSLLLLSIHIKSKLLKLPQFSTSSLFLKHQHYEIKILILITISHYFSPILLLPYKNPINSFSSHLPLYHKRSTIHNQTKTVNMSTNSNQKFLQKQKKIIIPSPSSSSSSLFHKFLQTHYKITNQQQASHLKTHRHKSFENPVFFLSNVSYALW